MADIEEVLKILGDETQPYPARIDALEELLGFNDRRVVDAVLGALTSQERYLRRKAAEVLGAYDVPQVADALSMAATSDNDEAVRRNAVRSLGQLSDPAALDALYRAAKDESLIVSKEAAAVLEKVRGARAESAREKLQGEVERVRRSAPPPAAESPPSTEVVSAPPPPPPAPEPPERPRPRPRRRPRPKPPEPSAAVEPAPPPPTAGEPVRPESPPPPEKVVVAPPPMVKGYVPPALARVAALRGLSASEELGWPDLLATFSLARRGSNMIFSALGLALALVGYAFITSYFGGNPNSPSLSGLEQPWLCMSAVGLWAWFILAGIGFKIARSAAVELATGSRPTLGQIYMFWLGRLTYAYQPAALAAILLAVPIGLIALAGYLSTLEVGGWVIGAVAYPLCLLGALGALLMCIGLVVGMPLMVPTMVVENTGCSDAVTSAWAYIFARPWRYALYWAAAIVHCAVVVVLVGASVCLAEVGIAVGAGKAVSLSPVAHLAPGASPLGVVHAVILFILGSYVISHYFTSRVGIYFLMRKAVDGIDLDAVHLPRRKARPGDRHGAPAGEGESGESGGAIT